MVVNRIADLAFTVGVLVIFYTFQSIEFHTVFGATSYFTRSQIIFGCVFVSPVAVIAVLLFFGAMGKSAQIGLHT
jgi:NADH-quinone oxidoreductase subunit L